MYRKLIEQHVRPLPRDPTETQWEELETELTPYLRESEAKGWPLDPVMSHKPVMDAIFNWKRRYKLMGEDR